MMSKAHDLVAITWSDPESTVEVLSPTPIPAPTLVQASSGHHSRAGARSQASAACVIPFTNPSSVLSPPTCRRRTFVPAAIPPAALPSIPAPFSPFQETCELWRGHFDALSHAYLKLGRIRGGLGLRLW